MIKIIGTILAGAILNVGTGLGVKTILEKQDKYIKDFDKKKCDMLKKQKVKDFFSDKEEEPVMEEEIIEPIDDSDIEI